MSYTTPVWLRFLLAVRFYALPLIGALSFVLPTQVFLLALSPNLNPTPFVWLAIGLGYASHLVMARVWLAFPKVVGAHTGALSSLCVLTCMLILDFLHALSAACTIRFSLHISHRSLVFTHPACCAS